MRTASVSLSLLALGFVIMSSSLPVTSSAQTLSYPSPPKGEQVDVYGSEKVADPYRALEDDHSPQTMAWVAAENRVTSEYLSRIPFRDSIKQRLTRLQDYAKYSAPMHKGPYLFFRKNDGL